VSLTFLLGVALFGGALIYFVLQPLLTGRGAPMGQADEEMTDAEARRRVTLLALRDVEYDRQTGKLDERDYQELKRELSSEALVALAAEQEERRAGQAPHANGGARGAGADGGILDLDAEIRRVRQGLRAGTTCRSCGHVNPGGSRFCSSCGSGLTVGGQHGEGMGG
jgi:cytochrome c-type biogenesis protein CcmI